MEAQPVHNECAPVFSLLAKADGLSEQSSAMLQAMVPHCLATREEDRHAYQQEMLQFLTEIIDGIEVKHLDAIASIKAEIRQARRSDETVLARPSTTEAEVAARKADRETQDETEKAASDAFTAAKAVVVAEQALLDGHAAEVSAVQAERDSFSQVVAELWVPLKAGFPAKEWRARNKVLERFMLEFEKLNLGVALNSAVPVALKTKVDDRGSFAKSAINFADVELEKHAGALASKISSAGDEAARRLGAKKTAEASLASAAVAREETIDSLVAAENRLAEAEARHKEAREAATDLELAAVAREAHIATAKANLSGVRDLIWQFTDLCTRCRARQDSQAEDSEFADLHVVVRPYGVLGTQMTTSKDLRSNSSEPGPDEVIFDPAGLHHIQASPAGAGGAARVIYTWLGIAQDERFPDEVREAIQKPLQAKYHAYGSEGERKCVHVVGPNFKERTCSRQEAVARLSTAYCAALAEFATSGLPKLRLLPLSGGIFSGAFGPELPELTAVALRRGFELLSREQQRQVARAESLEMCIFMEQEFAGYQKALNDISTLRQTQASA